MDSEEYDGEILEIAIEDTDASPQAIATIETETIKDSSDYQSRLIGLTCGWVEQEDSSLIYEPQQSDERQQRLLVTTDENGAIAIFLHALEHHGFDEETVYDSLEDLIDIPEWKQWRDSLRVTDKTDCWSKHRNACLEVNMLNDISKTGHGER